MKYNARYSQNPDNLAQLPRARDRAGRPSFHTALAEILAGCRRMLTPNGRLVMTLRPYRQAGRLIDLPGELEQLAAQNGLRLDQRRAALLCHLRGNQLIPRASFFQLAHQRSGRFPRMLVIAHEDVLVFAPGLKTVGSRTERDRR